MFVLAKCLPDWCGLHQYAWREEVVVVVVNPNPHHGRLGISTVPHQLWWGKRQNSSPPNIFHSAPLRQRQTELKPVLGAIPRTTRNHACKRRQEGRRRPRQTNPGQDRGANSEEEASERRSREAEEGNRRACESSLQCFAVASFSNRDRRIPSPQTS